MSNRLRIVSFVGALSFGGDENRLLAMGKSLDKSRFEHKVAMIYAQDDEFDQKYGSIYNQFIDAGIEVVDLGERRNMEANGSLNPLHLANKSRMLVRVVRSLRKLLRDWQCDVVDAHLTTSNLVAVLAGLKTGIPVAVTQYGQISDSHFMKRWMISRTMRHADAVVTDSEVRSQEYFNAAGGGRGRFVVIPNGVPAPQATESAEKIRAHFGLPEGHQGPVIAQISRMYPFKGHMVLLEVAKKVIAQHQDVHFLFVGFGSESYLKKLRDRAQELQVHNHVHINGYPGPIGDVWNIVDIHSHASLDDSLPNAILEGMSLGKPAVVTSVGGIPDMVLHEKTGLVVPPGDAQALADAILRMINEEGLSARLGEAAHQRYNEKCHPNVVTRQLEDLFIEMANSSAD